MSVVGHRSREMPSSGPWGPPDGLRPHTFEPIGCTNGFHIDDGPEPDPHRRDFSVDSYLRSPWLIAIVLLTDTTAEGGPTVLCPGSHHTVARLLSACPWRLGTNWIYSLLGCAPLWWRWRGRRSGGSLEMFRATGELLWKAMKGGSGPVVTATAALLLRRCCGAAAAPLLRHCCLPSPPLSPHL